MINFFDSILDIYMNYKCYYFKKIRPLGSVAMLRFRRPFCAFRGRLNMMNLLKKELMFLLKKRRKGYIYTAVHTKDHFVDRGYTKGDIVHCIIKGKITKIREDSKYGGISNLIFELLGKDTDNNPMLLVIAKTGTNVFKICTITPPIKSGVI